jgi:hypothetical protein
MEAIILIAAQRLVAVDIRTASTNCNTVVSISFSASLLKIVEETARQDRPEDSG